MQVLYRTVASVCVSVMFFAGGPVGAQVVGKVTNIAGEATVTHSGATRDLALKSDVSTGDLLKTNSTGQLQIAFVDRTRIVVGPSSELLIEDVALTGGKKASSFAVQALGGTFRFLSGRSPKSAYKLRTPTATMGIRGTEFDFSVDKRRLTNLVTFSGEVRICTENNKCARASGGCAIVTATRFRIKQPRGERAKLSLLHEDFPFVISQATLDEDFHVDVESCGEVGATPPAKRSTISIETNGDAGRQTPRRAAPQNTVGNTGTVTPAAPPAPATPVEPPAPVTPPDPPITSMPTTSPLPG